MTALPPGLVLGATRRRFDAKSAGQAFINDLGKSTFLILPNHGLLTVGGSIADAFLAMYTMQRACEIQVLAQSGGAKMIPIPQAILDGARAQAAQVTRGLGGQLAWPALLRKVERMDWGYRS
jgi:ribulose-5-phosphate 4-epimerase/fuculose-1-phosphate aldolase